MRKSINLSRQEAWISGIITSDDDAWIYEFWFGMDATCPKQLGEALRAAAGTPITLMIDSPGGYIDAAATMYEMIMAYEGPVTFEIVGQAHSAASFLTMASAKEDNSCKMSPLALMVIHNVQGQAEGDYRDMEHAADHLLTANQIVVNAYRQKTGMAEDEIRKLLDEETMLSAQDALSMKLVDEIMHQDSEHQVEFTPEQMDAIKNNMRNAMTAMAMPTRKAVEAMRNLADGKPEKEPTGEKPDSTAGEGQDDEAFALAKARTNLEKIRYGGSK